MDETYKGKLVYVCPRCMHTRVIDPECFKTVELKHFSGKSPNTLKHQNRRDIAEKLFMTCHKHAMPYPVNNSEYGMRLIPHWMLPVLINLAKLNKTDIQINLSNSKYPASRCGKFLCIDDEQLDTEIVFGFTCNTKVLEVLEKAMDEVLNKNKDYRNFIVAKLTTFSSPEFSNLRMISIKPIRKISRADIFRIDACEDHAIKYLADYVYELSEILLDLKGVH